MRSIRNAVRLGAAVLALSLAGAAAAHAQATGTYRTPSTTRTPSQPAVDRALREFGFNPVSLRADQQRALTSTWALLFPEANRFRTTLNSSQATALVYVALVHGRDRRGGWGQRDRDRWDDRDNGRDRDDDRDDDWNDDRGGRGGQCVELNQRLYDAQNALGSSTWSNYVSAAQKGPTRESLRDVQRLAVERGWRPVADLASEAMALLNENYPVRAEVLQRIQAIKAAVDESCAPGGGR